MGQSEAEVGSREVMSIVTCYAHDGQSVRGRHVRGEFHASSAETKIQEVPSGCQRGGKLEGACVHLGTAAVIVTGDIRRISYTTSITSQW